MQEIKVKNENGVLKHAAQGQMISYLRGSAGGITEKGPAQRLVVVYQFRQCHFRGIASGRWLHMGEAHLYRLAVVCLMQLVYLETCEPVSVMVVKAAAVQQELYVA